MRKYKLWAYIYMPILFLCLGYGILSVILSPVIDLVKSTITLVIMDKPTSDMKQAKSIFSDKKTEKKNGEKKTNIKEKETTQKTQPATIPAKDVTYPDTSVEYAKINIDKANIHSKIFFGDSPADLRKGVGQYPGSVFPGEVGTSLMGGHNTTDFGTMNLVDVGDSIVIETNYGTYTYKVTSHRVAKFNDPSAIESLYVKEGHKLILYTCYPMDMVGLTDDRLFVYADLESGPLIDAS
ncbi:class D sortase [Vagococcus vulneris]|nr:class D sortase [Vagococcus vulneris]